MTEVAGASGAAHDADTIIIEAADLAPLGDGEPTPLDLARWAREQAERDVAVKADAVERMQRKVEKAERDVDAAQVALAAAEAAHVEAEAGLTAAAEAEAAVAAQED